MSNDTPTVRTSEPSTHEHNSTETAECCDVDHIAPRFQHAPGRMRRRSRPIRARERGALASSDDAESPAECVSRILAEAEGDLKDRLEILKTAQARVLLSACFVHGVKMPKG